MLTLSRFNFGPTETESIISVGPEQLFSIEAPFRGYKPFVSCVRPGTYRLIPYYSQQYKIDTWVLSNPELFVYPTEDDVPKYLKGIGRYRCIFHAANWGRQLKGCIAPGWRRGPMADKDGEYHPSVKSSQLALEKLFDLVSTRSEQLLQIRRRVESW